MDAVVFLSKHVPCMTIPAEFASLKQRQSELEQISSCRLEIILDNVVHDVS